MNISNLNSTHSLSLGMCVFISAILLSGCTGSTGQPGSSDNGGEKVDHRQIEIKRTKNECEPGDESCTYFVTDFPLFSNFEGSEAINAFILDSLLKVSDTTSLIKEADTFIKSQIATYSESPGEELPWRYFKHIEHSVLGDSLIHIHTEVDEYTGGAHPLITVFHHNFNLKGELMTYESFFGRLTESEMSEKIMEAFLLEYGDEGEVLLLEDAIPVTANFIPGEESLIFVYNPYDIAPASAGIIKIEVPFNYHSSTAGR